MRRERGARFCWGMRNGEGAALALVPVASLEIMAVLEVADRIMDLAAPTDDIAQEVLGSVEWWARNENSERF